MIREISGGRMVTEDCGGFPQGVLPGILPPGTTI